MHKLGLKGRRSHILFRNIDQEKVVSNHIVSGLGVAGLESGNVCEMRRIYTQELMSVHIGNIPRERLSKLGLFDICIPA